MVARKGTLSGQLRVTSKIDPKAIADEVFASRELRNAANDFLLEEADYFQQNSPRGASEGLIRSWDVIPFRRSPVGLVLEGSIINLDPRANFKIAGRGPGLPPPTRPILSWALVKTGGNVSRAWALTRRSQKTIAERGTRRWQSGTNWVGINNDGSVIPGGRVDTMIERITEFIEGRLNT